jgi:hypothetical protein
MRTIKLLLVSTITFLTLINISPVNAKPVMKVQHLNVNSMLTSNFNSYDIINVAGSVPNTLSSNSSNNFSTSLILSQPTALSDMNSNIAISVINKSNDFFTSAMVFNDKLHQFISYFTTSDDTNITPSVSSPETKVIKKKCNSTLSFS